MESKRKEYVIVIFSLLMLTKYNENNFFKRTHYFIYTYLDLNDTSRLIYVRYIDNYKIFRTANDQNIKFKA